MTQDHTDQHAQDTEGPPDEAAAGDVSTTGHSARDAHVSHAQDTANDQGAHGGHAGHGHGDDTSEVPTLVPTTWRQLILPALIVILVAILVAGPLFGAFAPRPASPAPAEQRQDTGAEGGGGTAVPNGGEIVTEPTRSPTSPAAPPVASSPTTQSQSAPANGTPSLSSIATRTAVAEAGARGEVARIPMQVEFAGTTFTVKAGSNLLPDWKPPADSGLATWIEGTYANHILYLPYDERNAALFSATKPNDQVKVAMNTGELFVFSVTRSQRAYNGPPATDGQFTVTTAMAQDHAGVTLFLVGDPASDRAVVQADFTGTIIH